MLKIYAHRGMKGRTIFHQILPAMRTHQSFFFLLLSWLWPTLAYNQQMTATAVSSNEYKFQITGLPAITPAYPDVVPFYWIFTIFNDGSCYPEIYRQNPDGTPKHCWKNYPFPGITGTSTTFNYAYPNTNQLSFTPVSFIVKRKGDPLSPEVSVLNLPSAIPAIRSGLGSRPSTIPSGKSIGLAHNQGFLRATGPTMQYNKKSVFIVSYKPDCLSDSATVHLFYGRKRNGGPSTNTYIRSDHFVNPPIPHFPRYFDYSSAPTVVFTKPLTTSTSPFAYHSKFVLLPSYVAEVKSTIGSNNDQRLFQEVEYDATKINSDKLDTEEWSYALVVLTNKKLPDCHQNVDLGLLKQVDGFNGATLDNEYIVDIDTIYLKSGEPTDPNSMAATQICAEKDVTLQLRFCNLPTALEASSATINFSIEDQNFEWCCLQRLEYPEGSPAMTWKSCQPSCPGITPLNAATYDCNSHSLFVNKKLSPGGCAVMEVVLSLKSGADITTSNLSPTLYNYLSANHILKASVFLAPNPDSLIVESGLLPLDVGALLPCIQVSKPCEGFCFTFWHWLFGGTLGLALAIAGGIWWWKKKK